MPDLHPMTGAERGALHHAASDLHNEFAGVVGVETIEQLLVSSFEEMSAHAAARNQFRVVLVERFARERLKALARVQGHFGHDVPAVLFLCVDNAGRSQMALGWFTHLAGARGLAWSGGSQPIAAVNQAAVAAMAEVGIDISKGFSKPWSKEVLLAADVVITMGCGDACPLVPGKRYEDWEIEDPSGKTVAEIRPIRDEIGRLVVDLLDHLGIPANQAPRPKYSALSPTSPGRYGPTPSRTRPT